MQRSSKNSIRTTQNTASKALPQCLPSPHALWEIIAAQSTPLRLDRLLVLLGLGRCCRHKLEEILSSLLAQGRLLRLRGGLWLAAERLPQITGRFTALRDGGGFVTPSRTQIGNAGHFHPLGGRIHISPGQTGAAWHQDVVRVALTPGVGHGCSQEGSIVKVLERGLREIPAIADQRRDHMLFCRPADSRLPIRFRVELAQTAPQPGTLLRLEPLKPLAPDLWTARILAEYGREDDVIVQEELVKCNHEVPRDFPNDVLDEVTRLPRALLPEDFQHREDLRTLGLVTIDDADARDLDDAIHVQERRGGGWLLRVAIADVSHYVRPRGAGHAGALDREALNRGNSWYFPHSVEPMLPQALCHGLCSLDSGEDRLAVLVEIPFSATGVPDKPRFALAVVRCAARLSYDDVKACLLDKSPTAIEHLRQHNPRGDEILTMLTQALALSAKLRTLRRQRGSLDFDLPETSCRLDAKGRVIWLGVRERNDAHRLIEECMIAVNEAVARHLSAADLPFLYRVHPKPDTDRLKSLHDALVALGLNHVHQAHHTRSSKEIMHTALAAAHGTPREDIINRLCLRAMPQARYQPANEGHYGLASQAYCHFTSPIRRYADLLTHRALKASLGMNCGSFPAGQQLLRIADILSRRERATMNCEREMDRRLGCLALLPCVGKHFCGLISGIMPFGIFVALSEMPVEGMIRVEDLGRDRYDFDARSMRLAGMRTGVTWSIGQRLEVVLVDVDLGRLEIRLRPLKLPKSLRDTTFLRTRREKGRAMPPGRRQVRQGRH